MVASGEIDRAIAEFQAALKLNPRSYELHNFLGVCWVAKDDLGAAIREFREALSLNPGFGEARSNLGLSLIHI